MEETKNTTVLELLKLRSNYHIQELSKHNKISAQTKNQFEGLEEIYKEATERGVEEEDKEIQVIKKRLKELFDLNQQSVNKAKEIEIKIKELRDMIEILSE